ncbi:SMP-30/gluconolactonase/LRE family protein [Neiella sp. HB171785]|uniref:SMP-30/gluconolactonase/LRE family protein n=1 Tax=Neiella litorisoli TaxID=2771431 RepID=A0A8J6UN13_9GAMM|nr:SMP-30/gluconolactonase/LRE family protein [Neiella litorisoli]MBD1391305.1 SMP-30/gluconolactonase/LRE family protein [Neiella litorisoli]
MKIRSLLLAAVTAVMALTGCQQTTHVASDQPRIEIIDEQALQFVSETTQIEVLAEGFEWTEGPVWVQSQNALLFSDVPENVIYQWRPGVGVTEFLRPSGSSGVYADASKQGSNGLALDMTGQLLLCQHGDRRVSRLAAPFEQAEPNYQTLASLYQGKRFNSPNDLTVGKNGQIWFTDPPYGLPQGQNNTEQRELDFHGVYRLDTDGKVTLLTKEMTRPNGIALSNDEKTLYVANSDPNKAIWMAWQIADDGSLNDGRVLFDATFHLSTGHGLPDGLKVHPSGVLFATGPNGVLLLTPEGNHLATIHTVTASANVAFNQDFSSLFITSDNRLLRVAINP